MKLHTLTQATCFYALLPVDNYFQEYYFCTALHLDPVCNLLAAVDETVPSVTLSWDPPANIRSTEEVTEYQIDFIKVDHQNETTPSENTEMTVNGSTNSVVLTRESGLEPLTHYRFWVRGKSGPTGGDWDNVSRHYGRYCI